MQWVICNGLLFNIKSNPLPLVPGFILKSNPLPLVPGFILLTETIKQPVFLNQQNGFIKRHQRIAILDMQSMGTTGKSGEQVRGTFFIEEQGELGGAVVNKKSIGGKWEFEV